MPGRPGLIEVDDADELFFNVGFCSGVSRLTAGSVLRVVEDLRRASVYLTKEMIGVDGERVILRLPDAKREPILSELAEADLLQKVTVEPSPVRRYVQRELF